MSDNNIYINNFIEFQSDKDLLSVGKLISQNLLGGLELSGLDDCLHEEIPCIYIKESIFGMGIELDGYPGFNEDEGYTLYIDWYWLVKGEEDPVDSEWKEKYDFFKKGLLQYIRVLLGRIPEIKLIDP